MRFTLPTGVALLGALAGSTAAGRLGCSPSERVQRPFGQQTAGEPHSYRSANSEDRFELRPGDHWPLDIRHDGGKTERERSELSGPFLETSTRMIARFSFAVAEGPPTTATWTVLAQVHHIDFAGQQTYTVPFLLGLEAGDRLFVRGTVNPENTHRSFRDVVLWRSPRAFARGENHNVYISAKMDVRDTGSGELTVWFDGDQVVKYRGPIGIAKTSGYYWKYGLYRSQAPETTIVTFRNTCFGGPECQIPRGR